MLAEMAGKRRLTAKTKAFFAAYEGVAKLNAMEAARIAYGGGRLGNLGNPGVIAQSLRRTWPELFEQAEERYRNRFKLTDEELDAGISEIAKDSNHKDRLRALELIARMKGLLDNKVKVEIERKVLVKEIESVFTVIPTLLQVPAEPVKQLPAATDEDTNKPN
jgi:hypothetical protein